MNTDQNKFSFFLRFIIYDKNHGKSLDEKSITQDSLNFYIKDGRRYEIEFCDKNFEFENEVTIVGYARIITSNGEETNEIEICRERLIIKSGTFIQPNLYDVIGYIDNDHEDEIEQEFIEKENSHSNKRKRNNGYSENINKKILTLIDEVRIITYDNKKISEERHQLNKIVLSINLEQIIKEYFLN